METPHRLWHKSVSLLPREDAGNEGLGGDSSACSSVLLLHYGVIYEVKKFGSWRCSEDNEFGDLPVVVAIRDNRNNIGKAGGSREMLEKQCFTDKGVGLLLFL